MFDQVGGAGAGAGAGVASRVGRSPRQARGDRVRRIRRAELRIAALTLRDAADWADGHGVDESDPFAVGAAGGAGRFLGSDGTPWIDEFVAAEYGALRETTTTNAADLIIDALDLRHRFPRLWRAVAELRVETWIARRIAKACRDLSKPAAATVDAEIARKAGAGLAWTRLSKILAAAIYNADPALAQAKIDRARHDRRVWLSDSEDGLRTLIIKADQGDQVLLYALIERIAAILAADGDPDPVDVRRAKAAGWLARPDDLTALLYRHRHDGQPPPAAPTTEHQPPAEHQQPADDPGAGTEGSPPTAEPPAPTEEGWPELLQPPADRPPFDWGRPEPEPNPGVSDRLPAPADRWWGTQHHPRPEPFAPVWLGEPDDHEPRPEPVDLGPPGRGLRFDQPRLIDHLTAAGLKPAPPRVILHVHLTDHTLATGTGVVRSDDCGPMLLSQLTDLLGRHHCTISLRPILDPAHTAAVDAYEIPQDLRDAVTTRHPASVFPFSSRTGAGMDLDHTRPHNHTADPPGQTHLGGLGPLTRLEHRAKTHGAWHVEQPHPGVYLWRSPHGHYFLVTNQGSQHLGPLPHTERQRHRAPTPTKIR